MPSFGARSLEKLAMLDPRLRGLLEVAIKHVDFVILETRRGKRDQDEAFAMGRSKVRWPYSNHNCPIEDPHKPKSSWAEDPNGLSAAVDVAPWFPNYPHIRWADEDAFYYLQGVIKGLAVAHGVGIRFGGDWDMDGLLNHRDPQGGFNDLPHVELV